MTLIQFAPRARHTLLRVPPGVGKTYAALDAIKHPHLTTRRLSYLGPTTAFGEEVVARRRRSLPDDAHSQQLARHRKGRKHLCKNEKLDQIAAVLESAGRSALEVCKSCHLFSSCAWPKLQEDTGSGLIVGQHAHATSSFAKTTVETPGSPDGFIIDESMLNLLLDQQQKSWPLKTLRERFKKTTLKTANGKWRYSATEDLLSYRREVIDLLEGAKSSAANQRSSRA